jgi:hypothetical protein
MNAKHRLLVATMGAILALTLAVAPAFARVTYSYTSTLSQTSPTHMGAARPYSGNQIHIQLTTTSSPLRGGTYHISVYRLDCNIFVCWFTQVGGAGACPYIGFCGLYWTFDLGSGDKQYAFYFEKPNDGINISSSSVQMWSTTP